MPNPWDIGSARLLAAEGFEALATTSQGFAWAIGKHDQTVTRDELVAHVAELAAATPLPLNVDSERCYPDDPGGVAETVRLLSEAGAAGFSIEDYDPASRAHRLARRGCAASRRGRDGRALGCRATRPDRAGREPHSRRRRPRRHDRAPRRLPRRRGRRGLRARPRRSGSDRAGRGRGRHPGQRPRASGRPCDRRSRRSRASAVSRPGASSRARPTARWSQGRASCASRARLATAAPDCRARPLRARSADAV